LLPTGPGKIPGGFNSLDHTHRQLLFQPDRLGSMPTIVGIPTCATTLDGEVTYATSDRYAEALRGGADACSMLIPPMGAALIGVLDRVDGLLVPGSASNVHPSCYGDKESATPLLHDRARDATTLPMIREATARGIPVLAICRGIQELNVALGGTLHQNVHEIPGRHDHGTDNRAPRDSDFGPRHIVSLRGMLARIVGAPSVMVNSLHRQAIDRLAPGLSIDAVAEDGTIEAVSGTGGFLLGLQWHPEWRFRQHPASVAIFRAFGEACRGYRASMRGRKREAELISPRIKHTRCLVNLK
jgi:putative glutamine amidotransferase